MDMENVKVVSSHVFCTLLNHTSSANTNLYVTGTSHLQINQELFQVNTLLPSNEDNHCFKIANELNDWIWSGFNASIICHGTDTAHSSSVRMLVESVLTSLFQKCITDTNNIIKIGLSIWELDGTGKQRDLIDLGGDKPITRWIKSNTDALEILKESALNSHGNSNYFLRVVLCKMHTNNTSCDVSTLHIVRPALFNASSENSMQQLIWKLLVAGGHQEVVEQHRFQQNKTNIGIDNKEEEEDADEDEDVPGMQQALSPLLAGNCRSFVWVRVSTSCERSTLSALRTCAPCTSLTSVCVKLLDVPYKNLKFVDVSKSHEHGNQKGKGKGTGKKTGKKTGKGSGKRTDKIHSKKKNRNKKNLKSPIKSPAIIEPTRIRQRSKSRAASPVEEDAMNELNIVNTMNTMNTTNFSTSPSKEVQTTLHKELNSVLDSFIANVNNTDNTTTSTAKNYEHDPDLDLDSDSTTATATTSPASLPSTTSKTTLLKLLQEEQRLHQKQKLKVEKLQVELQEIGSTYEIELSTLKIERIEMLRRLRKMEHASNHRKIFAEYEKTISMLRADLHDAQETVIAFQTEQFSRNRNGDNNNDNTSTNTFRYDQLTPTQTAQYQKLQNQFQMMSHTDPIDSTDISLLETKTNLTTQLRNQQQQQQYLPESEERKETVVHVPMVEIMTVSEARTVKETRTRALQMLKQERIAMAEKLMGGKSMYC